MNQEYAPSHRYCSLLRATAATARYCALLRATARYCGGKRVLFMAIPATQCYPWLSDATVAIHATSIMNSRPSLFIILKYPLSSQRTAELLALAVKF